MKVRHRVQKIGVGLKKVYEINPRGLFLVQFLLSERHRDSYIQFPHLLRSNFFASNSCKKLEEVVSTVMSGLLFSRFRIVDYVTYI